MPIGVSIIDRNADFNVISYNHGVIQILFSDFQTEPDSTTFKTRLSKMIIRPIIPEKGASKPKIESAVSFHDFLNYAKEANQSVHGYLELPDDRIIEIRIMKGFYNNHQTFFLTFIDCSLAQRLEKLKTESQYKTMTLSMVSHELRTPVNAILGSLENIKSHIPPEGQVYIELAKNSCYMLSYQINDLTDYGKVSNSKLILDKSKVSLDETLKECISFVEWQAKNKKLVLEHTKGFRSPKTIWANSRRLKQVLLNLLTNAIKFTERGKVSIISEATDTEVKLTVKDTGTGIKEENIPKLFKEFGMLDEHRKMNSSGTGLGLYLSRKLMNEMQGEITVKSEYNKGTEFTLHFPLEPDNNVVQINADPTGTNSVDVEESKCECNKILVVDDTNVNLFVIKGLLEKIKIKCDIAQSGPEAIEYVKKRYENNCCTYYKLILMDYHMPGMSGPETTRVIKEITNKSHIIALTADNTEDLPEEVKSEFEGIMTKPLPFDELKELLRKYGLI